MHSLNLFATNSSGSINAEQLQLYSYGVIYSKYTNKEVLLSQVHNWKFDLDLQYSKH